MGEVVAPEERSQSDLVTALDLLSARGRRPDEDVGAEVLAREATHQPGEGIPELGRVVAALPLLVHPLHDARQPPRTVLGEGKPEVGMALERPGPQQDPQRASCPEPRLGRVDRHESVGSDDVTRGAPGVDVHDDAVRRAGRPYRLIPGIVVSRPAPPQRRDHQGPEPLGGDALDLLHCLVHVMEDGDGRDPAPALGAIRAQLGQPAVVGPGTRHHQVTVEVARGTESRPEGGRGAAAEHVGIGEDDLADDTFAVELGVADGGVPRGAPAAVTGLLFPLLLKDGRVDQLLPHPDELLVRRDIGIERLPVLRVQIIAVAQGRGAGVGVGGDDEVPVGVHGDPLVGWAQTWS